MAFIPVTFSDSYTSKAYIQCDLVAAKVVHSLQYSYTN